MKNASKTMFRIGNIFTFVYLGLGALLFIIGLISVIVGAASEDNVLVSSGGSLIGSGIYFVVTSILAFIFVGKAQKELNDESTKNNTPFIISIVFGAISGNVFYVLAGIFGLIAEGQQGNNEQPKEEKAEEPKEEPKAE